MISISEIISKKKNNERLTMITAYDYFTAKLVQRSMIDTILVGDSLGMVFKGEDNTLNVTVDEIVYHTKSVRKGADKTFIIADMPYMSFHLSFEQTKINASRFIIEGGANAVKLEGGNESRLNAIQAITDCEIPVVGHLGLTPQSIKRLGGYKVQGKENAAAEIILEQAKSIQDAGAFMLILEAVPELLAKKITEILSIPVIGIGAGRYTDGQVLVINDILALSEQQTRFSKIYTDVASLISDALSEYHNDVIEGKFPEKRNAYYPVDDI